MTVRGGGRPRAAAWLSCRTTEWVRRLGASLTDAHPCIMVTDSMVHRIQGCGARSSTLQKRAPLDIVMPTTASGPSCSELSRCGLKTLMLVALPQ